MADFPTDAITADRPEDARGPGHTTGEVVDAVRSLIELMARGSISELDLAFGGLSVRLRGQGAGAPSAPAAVAVAASAPAPHAEAAAPAASLAAVGHLITAPMIGTFYAAPSPGDPPFVEVGDEVAVGQTIGIIEAMKIMNEIQADRAGVVVAVIAADGEGVEYGSPLLRLRPHDGGTE